MEVDTLDAIERWSANAIDKTDAEKVEHYDAMREQNRLHMVWHGELQEALETSGQQLRGAVGALYSAHDFISRVLKWEGDDDSEQSEMLAEIAKHLPAGGR